MAINAGGLYSVASRLDIETAQGGQSLLGLDGGIRQISPTVLGPGCDRKIGAASKRRLKPEFSAYKRDVEDGTADDAASCGSRLFPPCLLQSPLFLRRFRTMVSLFPAFF